MILIAVTVFAGVKQYYFFRHANRALSTLVNPFNIFRAAQRNFRNQSLAEHDFVRLDPDAKRIGPVRDKPSVFILMVGETARADHWSLNGYGKDTNADLKKEDVISFKKVYSCATSTTISLPCMFSHKARKDFSTKEARYTENLVDLLKQTGYNVIWLENDEGSKGVANRITEVRLDLSKNKRYCANESCFDEILLDGLDERLSNIKQDTVIVLHTMGSHGPAYYLRYPDAQRKFKPTCDSSDVHGCDPEGLVNAYDNTIHYTSFVIARTIDALKKVPHLLTSALNSSAQREILL